MNKPHCLFISCFVCLSVHAQIWMPVQNFPGAKRDDGVGVIVNSTWYCGTGLAESLGITTDFYGLDLNTYTWQALPSMPIYSNRQYACVFPGNNCFYVFGGEGFAGPSNELYKFDITTQTWALMNPKPGMGLTGASYFSFGDKAIIVGGKSQAQMNHEVWEYTLSSDTWSQKNNFPFQPRWRSSQAASGNTGYLLCGIDSVWNFGKELYQYDFLSDSWAIRDTFPTPKGRGYAAMQVMQNKKLMVFGGFDSLNVYFNDTWLYDLALNSWTEEISMPALGRKGGMSGAHNDKFYYTCGIDKNNNRLNETWVFDVPLSVTKNSLHDFIAVYPTLADNLCFVEINLPYSSNITFEMMDANGKIIKHFLIPNVQKHHSTSIRLEDLCSGIYLLKFQNETGEVYSKKIIKKD